MPSDQEQPAVVLRTAATRLRALAANTSAVLVPGRWEIEYTYQGHQPQALYMMDPEYPDDPDMSFGIGIMDHTLGDNTWIAALSPAVAEPLAAWLDAEADCQEAIATGSQVLPRLIDAIMGRPTGIEVTTSLDTGPHALLFARLILNGDTTP
jgi:hypothetical protein